MRYFGIKRPDINLIWWLSDCPHNSWMAFFTYPNDKGQFTPHRLPLAEAIKAYEAIGYQCVELDIIEKTDEPTPDDSLSDFLQSQDGQIQRNDNNYIWWGSACFFHSYELRWIADELDRLTQDITKGVKV